MNLIKLLNFSEFNRLHESIVNEESADQITKIQAALKAKGEPYASMLGKSGPAGDGVDGKLGKNTDTAIRKFQSDNKLNPDGVVGDKTAAALGLSSADVTKPTTGKQSGNPSLATAHLLFNGNSVSFVENGKTTKSWPAISGRSQYQWFISPSIWMKRYNMRPEDWSKVPNEGPSPQGVYLLGPHQSQGGSDYLQADVTLQLLTRQKAEMYTEFTKVYGTMGHEFSQNTPMCRYAWGNHRYSLQPTKETKTFGRHSMFLHGGSVPGSIGCIDLSVGINDFANFFESWKKQTGYSSIYIKVDYKTFNKGLSITHPNQAFKLADSVIMNPQKWISTIVSYANNTLAQNFPKVKLNMGSDSAIAYNDAPTTDSVATIAPSPIDMDFKAGGETSIA